MPQAQARCVVRQAEEIMAHLAKRAQENGETEESEGFLRAQASLMAVRFALEGDPRMMEMLRQGEIPCPWCFGRGRLFP